MAIRLISQHTIRRHLIKDNAMQKCKQLQVQGPFLNSSHVRNRHKLAELQVDWPQSKWRNILSTDESK